MYLGVLAAALVRGYERMHGDVSSSPHVFHVVAAVFDASTAARIEDAKVEARVTPRRLAAKAQALEPMEITGTELGEWKARAL